jgi:PAS domain S-box-containing protein
MRAKYSDNFPGMIEHAVDILDSIDDALIALDRESRVVYVNKEVSRLLGRDISELVGKNISDVIPEAGGWMFYRHLEKATSENVKVKLENFKFVKRLFTTYFYPNSNGITILLHDITIQWHVDELYRLALFLLDRLNESVYLVRSDGRLFHVNDEISSLLGYSRNELIHMKIFDIDPDIPAGEWDGYFKRIRKEIHVEFESCLKARDGRIIPVDVSVNYIQLYGNEYYCAAARNITERKQVEAALAETRAQAELYVDLMSHDINNLNQVALGYLELIGGMVEDEKLKELISKPLEAINNSSHLIESVTKLQNAKTGQLKTGAVDLDGILSELQARYSRVQDKDVIIRYTSHPGCLVMANGLIKDVFSNLIENAIKHSSQKSVQIDIGLKRIREDGKDYFEVSVEDYGSGVTDEMKKKLFGRFHRGDTKANGKGLGLYLVKTLVEGYKGQVWAEDRIQGDHTKGARFVVMLPAVEK